MCIRTSAGILKTKKEPEEGGNILREISEFPTLKDGNFQETNSDIPLNKLKL